ncbi:UbiA family prenyltransferase [Candidatus Chloroploca sp. Khr17]|uniref:UbiA family prenyltransferase n=1 Tax=Candidatus Chloroploca sp. Khr17 TaxID=2496869 RepID=UPI00101D2C2E|nr:UbiA family prenyltransferase [Candidatus Chloroploca sp. Khr17]
MNFKLWLDDLYRFVRFSASGATMVLPVLGAVSVELRLSPGAMAKLVGMGAAFHVFAYVHNDLCDRELDRTQPLRVDYPLIQGRISPPQAGAVAALAVPAAFALQTTGMASTIPLRPARLALGLAVLALGAYNHWGKRVRWPILTDLIQALGWTALLAAGALQCGKPTRLTALLAIYESLVIMLVNGVHGALRDLANDRDRGAQTTAIMFGATVNAHGTMEVPLLMKIYALSLQLCLLILPLWGASTNQMALTPAAQRVALGAVSLVVLLTGTLFGQGLRGKLRPVDLGMLHLILLLSMPIALVSPGMVPTSQGVLLTVHMVPLLANGMTWQALQRLGRH